MFIASILPLAAVPCDKVPCVPVGDIQMPVVALGTWRGSYKDCSPPNNYTCIRTRAQSSVEAWLKPPLSGTHVDTANDYRTQVEVGKALAASRVKREDVL
eukprot:999310-Prymnesium_polylepis.1